MTNKELRKQKFKALWKQYEAEAATDKQNAKSTTGSERDFWVTCFNQDMEMANHFFNEYMNA